MLSRFALLFYFVGWFGVSTGFISTRPPTHPLSKNYHENYLKRLNSRNKTIQANSIVNPPRRYSFHQSHGNSSTLSISNETNLLNNGLGVDIDADAEEDDYELDDDEQDMLAQLEEYLLGAKSSNNSKAVVKAEPKLPRIRILINKNMFAQHQANASDPDMEEDDDSDPFDRFGITDCP